MQNTFRPWRLWAAVFFLALLLPATGCRQQDSATLAAVSPTPDYLAYLEEGEELSGGQATVFDTTPNAFSRPVPGLEREQELLFFVGNSFFNQNWVTAPASTTARDGLGPLFNARSCASCHFKDGRGRPPEFDGELPTGFLIRLSVPGSGVDGEPSPEPSYGGQVQDQAVMGLAAEASVIVAYEDVPITLADGQTVNLRRPVYNLENPIHGEPAPETMISPRVANQMIGLGLLEAVPEEAILALADPNDQDGDGISGRPNTVWDVVNGRMALGRFGWKANEPTVAQQTAGAFLGDMGITTRSSRSKTAPMPSLIARRPPTEGRRKLSRTIS